uniref:Protein kinase domain-containing protein n=1 Tax=viral metagenome TaxID=1070528 RepID=A0A6C0KFH7_9ZZZZ
MSSQKIKKGKDGTITYHKRGKLDVVTKTFRKNKNRDSVKQEIHFMKKAHRLGVSPKIYEFDVNVDNPYIVMDELGKTLVSYINKTGKLSQSHQRQIISILERLDDNCIFHGDVSPLNFMTGKGDDSNNLYIIDFGMAKKMDKQFIGEHGKNANVKLGITVFILKIREQLPSFMPELLLKKVHSTLKL